jgi:putative phosphoesterase
MNSAIDEQLKVGILSDTHNVLDERVADVIRSCDYAIHAGDIGHIDVLNSLHPKKETFAVRGNNDYGAGLESLPDKKQIELPGGLLIVEHGHCHGGYPDHDALRCHHADARLIVYGHTHKRVIDRDREPWVVNPGAAGKERTKGGPSCLVLHASTSEWHIETFLFKDSKAA